MGMTREEQARKKELHEKLFLKPTDRDWENKGPVSPSEVPEFLRLAAKSHKAFYHYTCLDALEKMLEKTSLRLTSMNRLNDLREGNGIEQAVLERTYVASFGWSIRESVAMWWMYGLQGNVKASERVPIRLAFKGDAVREAVAAVGHEKGQTGWKADFFDVLYQFSARNPAGLGSVSWNKEIANEKRCEGNAFRDAAKAFPGFVKDGGWDYEGETRICIELPKAKGTHISIPFAGALETVQVLVGPGQEAPVYLEMAKERLEKWGIGVDASVCEVRFPVWEKKGKGKR
jgi:hypothetical protein